MGGCCGSRQDEEKLERKITAFQRKHGLGVCDFTHAARVLDVYSTATKEIEATRIPILSHSLGFLRKGSTAHCLSETYAYLAVEGKWCQKRLAVLCALTCPGSNLTKAAYLMKMYSPEPDAISLEHIQEIVSHATTFALMLIPTGAKEYYKDRVNSEQGKKLHDYLDLLASSAEKAKTEIMERVGNTTPKLTIDVFNLKVANGTLNILTNASLLRKMTHAAKQVDSLEGAPQTKTSG